MIFIGLNLNIFRMKNDKNVNEEEEGIHGIDR